MRRDTLWRGSLAVAGFVTAIAVAVLWAFSPKVTAQSAEPHLVNPGFEGDFYNWNNIGELTVGIGWIPWWVEGGGVHRPEWKAELRGVGAGRVLSGDKAQKQFTTFSAQDGGVYQRIAVVPNEWYKFTCHAYVWSSDSDDANQSKPPRGKYSALVGINPWGDTRATYRTTIWGKEALDVYDRWVEVSVTAQAWSDHITVFTRGTAEWAVKHNDSYWDICIIERVDIGNPTPQPTYTPYPTPEPCPTCVPGGECDYNAIRGIIREELDSTKLSSTR